MTKEGKDDDVLYLTCRNINDPSRSAPSLSRSLTSHPSSEIVFELTSVGGGLVQYCPTLMQGFDDDSEDSVPDFIVNDIFFKEKHLPIFLSKLILEVGKDPHAE